MRKNRKISRRFSVIALNVVRIGVIVVMAAVMSIVTMLAKTSNDQLQDSIGEKEKALDRLEAERERINADWEAMKVIDKLELHLRKNGIAMRFPTSEQVIRLKSDGTPCPAQISVAKARQRNGFSAAHYRAVKDDGSFESRSRGSSRRIR